MRKALLKGVRGIDATEATSSGQVCVTTTPKLLIMFLQCSSPVCTVAQHLYQTIAQWPHNWT
jgi:hypothetical protein